MSKQVLIYDIATVPSDAGLDIERVLYIYENHNIVLFDSQQAEGPRTPEKPQVVNVPDGTQIEFLDFSIQEQRRKAQNRYYGRKE